MKDGAPSKDGIMSKGWKCISDHVATPLTRLTNLSFSRGVFPNELKVALVSPLYKAKDPMIFSNYRPISLEWFKSYISNRYQVIKYNDYESEARKILCGVPQGSILGQLLFLIYINDLPMVSSLFMPILFVDDTNLFCTNDKFDILVSEIDVKLINIHKWVKINKLSLNIEKTNFMLFTPNGFSRNMNCINIDGHRIEEVRQTKFLGVILDNKLNWHAHCEYICGKMSKGIGLSSRRPKYLMKLRCCHFITHWYCLMSVTVFMYGVKHMTHT